MPVKRRNHGRNKKNKGHSNSVVCCTSGKHVPKDKAIKRFQMRNLVDGSSKRDIKDNYAFDQKHFHIPKVYVKLYYSIACAIHSRIVRLRSVKVRGSGKGDRFKRYTTKLRQHVRLEALTGSGALPLIPQDKLKFLNKESNKKPE
jgi:small subunit ribosomal protein S26e